MKKVTRMVGTSMEGKENEMLQQEEADAEVEKKKTLGNRLKSKVDSLLKSKCFQPSIKICIVMVVATCLSYTWAHVWSIIFGFEGYYFEWAREIFYYISQAFNEEVVWRYIPICIATLCVVLIRNRFFKIACSIIFIVTILVIQAEFGLSHYNALEMAEGKDSALQHVILQGGDGLFYALAYFGVWFIAWRSSHKNPLGFICSHLIALGASSIIHFLTNVMIMSYSYDLRI